VHAGARHDRRNGGHPVNRPDLLMHPAAHAPACVVPDVVRYRAGSFVVTRCLDNDCRQVFLRPAHH